MNTNIRRNVFFVRIQYVFEGKFMRFERANLSTERLYDFRTQLAISFFGGALILEKSIFEIVL